MEDPAREIGGIIKTLTTGSPPEQEAMLNTYFVPDASFVHPYCVVPAFPKAAIPLAPSMDSRWLLLGIYRWYRILSPHIDIQVDSAVLDENTGRLFVSIRQIFSLWFVPFHKAPVDLVTVLHLTQRASATSADMVNGDVNHSTRYYITKQDDRYQINDCIRLIIPWFLPFLWFVWQLCSTGVCVIGSLLLMPLYLFMNNRPSGRAKLT